jgi:glutamyl-tRNA reductase
MTTDRQQLREQLEPIRQNEVARFLKKAGLEEHSLLEKVTEAFLEKIIQLSTQRVEAMPETCMPHYREAVYTLFSRPE